MVKRLWIAAFALAGALALGCRDRNDDGYGGSGRIEEQRSTDFRSTPSDQSGVAPGQETTGSQLPEQGSGVSGTSSDTTPGTGGSGTTTGEPVLPPEQQPLDKDLQDKDVPKDQQEEIGSEKQMSPERMP